MKNKSRSIKISHFLATGFYSGLSPIMPGTCGTLVSALILFVLNWVFPGFYTPAISYLLAFAVTIIAVITSNICLRHKIFGGSAKDPQQIVIDEFAGYYVTLIGFDEINIPILFWGFIFFRLFDMTKLSIIKRAELLPQGWGIVADDVVAGVFAAICLRLALFLF